MHSLIQHRRLDSAAASITFENIPQNFSDLKILLSGRSSTADVTQYVTFTFNGSTSGYSFIYLFGNGGLGQGTFASGGSRSDMLGPIITGANATVNTFGNAEIYIPNYRASQNKAIRIDAVMTQNATEAYPQIWDGVWANTAAIQSITLSASPTFTQFSSATLYGINRTQAIGRSPQAVGGSINYANGYWYHTFTGSGNFVPFNNMQVEYLVVAGGAGGGRASYGGGGGAGGYRSSVVGELSGGGASAESMLSLTSGTNYAVVVGAGGASFTNGSNSSFGTITSTGGGRGGSEDGSNFAGAAGGSGGGECLGYAAPGAGTAGQGYNGGLGNAPQINHGSGGGGGGAGSPGVSSSGFNAGNGGAGVVSSITGTPVARAGGGGGSGTELFVQGLGRDGGGNGGQTAPTSGVANTGGGGGGRASLSGGFVAGSGGSGIVIVRYKG